MRAWWGWSAAVCAIAAVSIVPVAIGWDYESATGTPIAAGTPLPMDQAAFPVRAGDRVTVTDVHVILQPEPTYSAERVAMLPQHQVLEATGRTVIRDGERWLELRYPVTGDVGWVSDRWLSPLPAATPSPVSSRDGLTVSRILAVNTRAFRLVRFAH